MFHTSKTATTNHKATCIATRHKSTTHSRLNTQAQQHRSIINYKSQNEVSLKLKAPMTIEHRSYKNTYCKYYMQTASNTYSPQQQQQYTNHHDHDHIYYFMFPNCANGSFGCFR